MKLKNILTCQNISEIKKSTTIHNRPYNLLWYFKINILITL